MPRLRLPARAADALPRRPPDPGRVPLRRPPWTLRRLLSAGLAAAAVASALHAVAPAPAPVTAVVAVIRDLPSGYVLSPGDLRLVDLPPGVVPASALSAQAAAGRSLAGAVSAGEVLTAARVTGPGLLTGQAGGRVAAPVRVADGAAAAMVQVGSRVDVLVAAEGARRADVVATSATVLAAGAAGDDAAGLLGSGGPDPASGGLLVLAVTPEQAAGLAAAAGRGPLSIALR